VLIGRYGDRIGRRRAYPASLHRDGRRESRPFTSSRRCCPTRPATTRRACSASTTRSRRSPDLSARCSRTRLPRRIGLLVYPVAAAPGLAATHGRSAARAGRRPRRRAAAALAPLAWDRRRLSALFALDSHGGSFVPQAFVAYLFHPQVRRLAADARAVVFAIGLLQAVSFQGAVRLAGRIGLLRTMVFTHLPSNVLPAGVAFAPDLTTAIALLLARFLLSQADPTREAYVVIAGPPKSVYDIGLCTLFRRVPLHTAAA